MTEKKLLSPKEMARELGVRQETLCRWRRTGKGPPFVQSGRYIRYPRKYLDDFLTPPGLNKPAG